MGLSKKQRGIVLKKSLVKTYERPIGVEIGSVRREIKRLTILDMELSLKKARGEKTVSHWGKEKFVNGIPIKYKRRGLNKVIYYQAGIDESPEKFNARVKKIMVWLQENGYEPELCRETGIFELETKGATCDLTQ